MKKKGRRFFVPAAQPVAAVSNADKPTTKRRRFFAPPPAPAWESGCALQQQYGLPPREVCDECGARASVVSCDPVVLDGHEYTTKLLSASHAPDCSFAGWPHEVYGGAMRATVAGEWRRGVNTCMTCGAHGVLARGIRVETADEIAHDAKLHLWWCGFWDVHQGVTPF